MAQYTSVLHQLLRYVPRDEFRAIVERHQGDKGVRKLSSWGQFVALFFGQLKGLRRNNLGAALLEQAILVPSNARWTSLTMGAAKAFWGGVVGWGRTI